MYERNQIPGRKIKVSCIKVEDKDRRETWRTKGQYSWDINVIRVDLMYSGGPFKRGRVLGINKEVSRKVVHSVV